METVGSRDSLSGEVNLKPEYIYHLSAYYIRKTCGFTVESDVYTAYLCMQLHRSASEEFGLLPIKFKVSVNCDAMAVVVYPNSHSRL